MAEYQTQYQHIPPYEDDGDDDDTGEDTDNHVEAELLIHVVPEGSKGNVKTGIKTNPFDLGTQAGKNEHMH